MRPMLWIVSWLIAGLVIVQAPSDSRAVSPLRLSDATFTEDVVNRQPSKRVTTFSLGEQGGDARLWFWFRVNCAGACLAGSTHNPRIPIFVKWAYHQDGKFIVKSTVPLRVQGDNWRTWAYKQNLTPGTWLVAVFSEEGVVCLDHQCDFTVEVTP